VCVCVCVCWQYTAALLERIARAVGLTLINEHLSIDEAADEIIERARQLCDVTSRDQQSLIHTLQHKLRSLKERLDFKVDQSDCFIYRPTCRESLVGLCLWVTIESQGRRSRSSVRIEY